MNESANHSEHVGAISDAHRIGNPGCRGDVRATTLSIPTSEGWFLRRSLKLKLTLAGHQFLLFRATGLFIYFFFLYTLAVSPSLGGSRQHKRNNKNNGFHSVLPAMTRDPAEFGWHCWSNTAHPPQSSTTYVAS